MALFMENEEQEIIDIRRTTPSSFIKRLFSGKGLSSPFYTNYKNDGNKRE